MKSAKKKSEHPSRIEPTRLLQVSEELADVVSDVSSSSATLGSSLHPETAANLSQLVRIMNCYYSNLIEGHNTRLQEIERALEGSFESDTERRNLQFEARAHINLQAKIDAMALQDALPEPASAEFLSWLHREFYIDAPEEMLAIEAEKRLLRIDPGKWRSGKDENVAVGRHLPPSSAVVESFIEYFENCYKLEGLGSAAQILAIPAAHHRLNFIHPFLDGNGRVSRLMSHAMGLKAGIGAGGLWSVSRGLARGLDSRSEYKSMMDLADSPRKGDLDGRGNLSLAALEDYCLWFLRVCLDQINFMASLFEFSGLKERLERYVELDSTLKPQAAKLLLEALQRGQFERGEASRITGLPERSARRLLNEVIKAGLLKSKTPKGAVSLRFPADKLDVLFPRLYSQA